MTETPNPTGTEAAPTNPPAADAPQAQLPARPASMPPMSDPEALQAWAKTDEGRDYFWRLGEALTKLFGDQGPGVIHIKDVDVGAKPEEAAP